MVYFILLLFFQILHSMDNNEVLIITNESDELYGVELDWRVIGNENCGSIKTETVLNKGQSKEFINFNEDKSCFLLLRRATPKLPIPEWRRLQYGEHTFDDPRHYSLPKSCRYKIMKDDNKKLCLIDCDSNVAIEPTNLNKKGN